MTSPKTGRAGSASTWLSPMSRTIAVVVPVVLALGLGVRRSVQVPLWRDEYATALHAALAPPDLARALSDGDAVQGPYYALMHLLAPSIGPEAGMRVPSLLAFAATAAIVAALGLRWWGPLPGLTAGLFFSLNGAAITAGVTARPYALMLMFVALAVYAADVARPGPKWWWWVGYGAAATLAVAAHLLSILAVLCIGTLALGRPGGWLKRWAVWTVPSLAVGALLAGIGATQQAQIAWLSAPDARSGASALAQVAGVSVYRAVVWDAVGLVALALAGLAALVVSTRLSASRGRVRPLVLAASLGFLAPAAFFAFSWIVTPIYTARYLSWVSIGSALIVGGAVSAAMSRVRIWSAVAGSCAAVLIVGAAAVAVAQSVRIPGVYDDVPALVREMEERAAVGDGVAVIQRNPHTGVAYAVSRVAGDAAWAAGIADRLPDGTQPTVDSRSVLRTDPLTLDDPAPMGRRALTVWIVSLDSPSTHDLAQIDATFRCRTERPAPDPLFFGGMRLYPVRCR